jgi:hypothetical protein
MVECPPREGTREGHLSAPPGAGRPSVVAIHEIWGLGRSNRDAYHRLAEEARPGAVRLTDYVGGPTLAPRPPRAPIGPYVPR